METFEIRDQFYLNGKPFKIISGAFHYFRTVPEYWRDRLEKLRNMGCNTLETYIPWNFHEPKKGQFLFDGMHDIERFIQLATELDFYIILRPAPYICSEWEFGGLPAWLLADRNMRLRCSYGPYLQAVREYYEVLIPKLTPYQIDRGGKVIMMQLENEYGYYGNDTAYMEFLRDTVRELGVTVPLATSDGPGSETCFKSGMVDGALPTGNFGSSGNIQFGRMREYMGEGKPLMCMEFWNGWFDAWNDGYHHTTSAETAAKELDEMLSLGSANFYMFQGGTNFGFMSGQNVDHLTPDVTSYDYDAPLTEDGRINKKYALCRDVIAKYTEIKPVPLTMDIKRKSYGQIPCNGKVNLFATLEDISTPVHSVYPLTMEEIGSYYGYLLYRAQVRHNLKVERICLEGASDRVQAYQNGKHIFTAFAENIGDVFQVAEQENGPVIDLLVDNLSRKNFGTGIENQRKGIAGGVVFNDVRHFGFDIYPLPLDEEQISKLDFSKEYTEGAPAFYRFELEVDESADTFLDFGGFGKGCAFLNGFNLGRYWETGPQKRLYIPGPLLKKGKNTIILLETEGKAADSITLADEPDLG